MTTSVLVVSADHSLVNEIRRRAGPQEYILRLTEETAVVEFLPNRVDLVVLDCRHMGRAEVEGVMLRTRARMRQDLRLAAVTNPVGSPSIEVIGFARNRDLDMIVPHHDAIGGILRAIANDPFRSTSAGIALCGLARHLTADALDLAGAVLGSGCQISTVKQLEAALGRKRGALTLRPDRSPFLPDDLVRIARAVLALVLIRKGAHTQVQIARAVGYSAPRWVRGLIQAEFRASEEVFRRWEPEAPIERFLDFAIGRWRAGRPKESHWQAGSPMGFGGAG